MMILIFLYNLLKIINQKKNMTTLISKIMWKIADKEKEDKYQFDKNEKNIVNLYNLCIFFILKYNEIPIKIIYQIIYILLPLITLNVFYILLPLITLNVFWYLFEFIYKFYYIKYIQKLIKWKLKNKMILIGF